MRALWLEQMKMSGDERWSFQDCRSPYFADFAHNSKHVCIHSFNQFHNYRNHACGCVLGVRWKNILTTQYFLFDPTCSSFLHFNAPIPRSELFGTCAVSHLQACCSRVRAGSGRAILRAGKYFVDPLGIELMCFVVTKGHPPKLVKEWRKHVKISWKNMKHHETSTNTCGFEGFFSPQENKNPWSSVTRRSFSSTGLVARIVGIKYVDTLAQAEVREIWSWKKAEGE